MKKRFILFLGILGICVFFRAHAQEHRYDPPWNTPPQASLYFTVPGIENVPDLFGDINDPQLVIFFAGNQFMCIDDLISGFKKDYPQYTRVFAETLPPEILAKQILAGNLVIGNLKIDLKPDIYTAGKSSVNPLLAYFSKTEVYAQNKLAIMVQEGNPKKIQGLKDFERKDVRISMPNPEWEGIGKLIEKAYVQIGGEDLRRKIMEDKLKEGSTFLTQIHHRQSALRILNNESDAAPVWYSEAIYQIMIHHPIEMINIPDDQNLTADYIACQLKNASHKKAADDFMNYLMSQKAQDIYKKYGFTVH